MDWSLCVGVVAAVCLLVHIAAMTEIIGGWYLTWKKQGIRWDVKLEIMLPMFVPLLSLFDALNLIGNAEELYRKVKPNRHFYRESLYCYFKYGRMTISEYYCKNRKLKCIKGGKSDLKK